jgi:hypothetical protein
VRAALNHPVRGDLDGLRGFLDLEHRDREDRDHDGELEDDEAEADGDERIHCRDGIK